MLEKRLDKAGKCPLQCRVTIKKIRAEFSPNIKVDPKKWNSDKNQVEGTSREARDINDRIEKVKQKLFRLSEDLEKREEEVTSKKLVDYYKGEWSPAKVPTILELFDQQMEFMRKSADKKKAGLEGYTEGYIETFAAAQTHLKEFIMIKYKAKDLHMNNLQEDFLDRFEEYLLADTYVNAKNTAVKNCTIVKRIIKRGRAHLKNNVEYIGRKEKTFAAFLTLEELITMETKDISIERLDNIRKRYIFSCFTGYAFSDQDGLRNYHVVTDENGRKWILDKSRQKTGEPAKVPLLPAAIKVIEHFKNLREVRGTGLDLQMTAKVMGHATTKQTQMYRKNMHEILKETLEANKAFDKDILKR